MKLIKLKWKMYDVKLERKMCGNDWIMWKYVSVKGKYLVINGK